MSENKIEKDHVMKTMELAWRDHHHARDQTWKTIQMVAVLGAGLISVDFKFENEMATLIASALVIMAAVFGIFITWHHRKLERRKCLHIMNCEEYLNLHKDFLLPLNRKQHLIYRLSEKRKHDNYDIDNYVETLIKDNNLADAKMKKKEETALRKSISDLINDASVGVPNKFGIIDVINPLKSNTSLFILRMHISIIFFAVLIALLRFGIL